MLEKEDSLVTCLDLANKLRELSKLEKNSAGGFVATMGWAIAIQGGAGDIPIDLPDELCISRETALRYCLDIGVSALKSGKPPLDVVELVGVETVEPSHFITPANIAKLKQAQEVNQVQLDYTNHTPKECGESQVGTVGCVAVDGAGNLASVTSTGGHVNKMVGRIGDTPIIGAGTYANHICAVSATGIGEEIMRGTVARDVAALMEYKGLSLTEAAACAVHQSVPKGTCGLIAVSANGEVTMPFNTTGMFRACCTEDGYHEIGIWQKK